MTASPRSLAEELRRLLADRLLPVLLADTAAEEVPSLLAVEGPVDVVEAEGVVDGLVRRPFVERRAVDDPRTAAFVEDVHHRLLPLRLLHLRMTVEVRQRPPGGAVVPCMHRQHQAGLDAQ